MPGRVPPVIQSPKSFIGVGTRELVVLGGGAMLALLTLLLPFGVVLKVFLGVLVVGLALALAFGRDKRSGKTVEAVLYDVLRFHKRARYRQKGADGRPPPAPGPDPSTAPTPEAGASPAEAPGWIRVRPLPLGGGLLLSILSLAFLAALLAWVWLGGLEEIRLWFLGPGFQALLERRRAASLPPRRRPARSPRRLQVERDRWRF